MNDEPELLAKIRSGAPDDFAEIIRQHQDQVFKILYRYERDPHLIEDLVQETFIKTWNALDQFDGRAPFSHWLSRITVHVALDHLRKRKRVKNEIALDELGEDALDWLRTDECNGPLQSNQAREILEVAMRELSPEERIVITLLEIEGRSVKEIAALTDSSGVAVRVRAFRARAKLRNVLLKMEKKS